MKISLNWLSNYIDISEFYSDTDKLSEILTNAGLEVDGVEDMAKSLNNVVIGKISTLEKHPDADKLTLCQLDVGAAELSQIICGAKNHKAGDKVVVALPGAVLPGDFKIKKSKIRGVESLGMLCSDTELGLADESEGIRILPETATVGQKFSEFAGLNDIVFNLSVTANRADCLSHLGLARELSCLLDKPLKSIDTSFTKSDFKTSDIISVELSDTEKCSRYTACVIKGVKIGESPSWLKTHLSNVDINSVNNVVDITNYVMLEYGQPMHAFDLSNIGGSQIQIKSLDSETSFTSLDGTEYQLKNNELVICDKDRVVALAGVVGGQNSGINDSTKDLVLEVAHFNPGSIRKTSRSLGIETDSSYRFARGTDISALLTVINRASHLIQKICGGEVASEIIDQYPKEVAQNKISIEYQYVSDRLGYYVEPSSFKDWMVRLGCQIIDESESQVQLQTPTWRCDLEIKEDLVEEFGRLNGYDNIPESLPPLSYEPLDHDASYLQNKFTYNFFAKQGFHQSVNYNFINPGYCKDLFGDLTLLKECGLSVSEKEPLVQNPLSEEYKLMRPSLIPSLYKNLLTNYRGGVSKGQLFEVGSTFGEKSEEYYERTHLALCAWGKQANLWGEQSSPQVLNVKSVVENYLTALKAKSWSWKRWPSKVNFMHPERTAILFYQGKNVGYITELHPKLKQGAKFRDDVAFAEFDLSFLMQGFPKKPKLKPISKYPAVERDFSFVVANTTSSDEIKSFIKKIEKKLIMNITVIDRYLGKNLPEGKKSLTYKVLFQDSEKTMTEDTIKKIHSEILKKVQEKFA